MTADAETVGGRERVGGTTRTGDRDTWTGYFILLLVSTQRDSNTTELVTFAEHA